MRDVWIDRSIEGVFGFANLCASLLFPARRQEAGPRDRRDRVQHSSEQRRDRAPGCPTCKTVSLPRLERFRFRVAFADRKLFEQVHFHMV